MSTTNGGATARSWKLQLKLLERLEHHRFWIRVAVHVRERMMLSVALARREGIATLPSTTLAQGLAANPALVRKLIVPLVDAGLLQSSRGKLGGVGLARAADRITLADIYRAVVAEKKLFGQRQDIPHRCLVSSGARSLYVQSSGGDHLSIRAESPVNTALVRSFGDGGFCARVWGLWIWISTHR